MGTIVSKGDAVTSLKNPEQQHAIHKLEASRELQISASSSIIEEKERRRNQEQNEPETQMAITDAEKMLGIYRKEMKASTEPTPSGKDKQPEVYNKPKIEVYNRPKQQYKTSDYDDCGRATPIPPPKGEPKPDESKSEEMPTKESVVTNQNTVHEYSNSESSTSTIHLTQDRTEETLAAEGSDKQIKRTQEEKEAEQKQVSLNNQKSLVPQAFPGTLQDGITGIKEQGSLLTKNVSQYCPTLLDQRANVGTSAPLKPLDQGTLNFERQIVRSELENQGILAPGTYAEAAKQGILYELQTAGIIYKDTRDEKYTMSVGSPIRRPPPRLTQLPPLNTPPSSKATEVTFKEFGRPPLSFNNKDFSFVDYGRPLPANPDKDISEVELTEKFTYIQEQGTQTTPTLKTKKEYVVTHGGKNIGDANRLKLKMFDLETL